MSRVVIHCAGCDQTFEQDRPEVTSVGDRALDVVYYCPHPGCHEILLLKSAGEQEDGSFVVHTDFWSGG
jgi:hypothetical protein